MALITNITTSWSAGTLLAATEIWQCRTGKVAISVQAAPDDDEGIELMAGDALRIVSGNTVKYRLAGGSASSIAREATE